MPDGIRWVGLDVHAHESTLAIFDQATGEVTTKRVDRVKTDKRDAIRLARLLAAGELTLVTIPSVEREQLRDLVRCREDIRVDLMRARNRIGKFLLRREIYWEGPGETWSRNHRSWLTSVRFADQASRATLADYLHAHDVLIARRDQIEAELANLATSAPCAHTIARLRCLRGIDTLTALGLCAEIGEWGRFDHPDQLSASLGIVPSEHQWQPAPVGFDHQGRLHARSTAAGRGVLPLPPRPRGRCSARAPPARASARDHQHLLESATPAQRSLAPTQRHAPQTRRDRRRPRARRLLLRDRHLHFPCRPGSAGIPADGRPPHAHSLAPTEAHTNAPQETQQLTLTPSTTPVTASEAARGSRLAHKNSAIRRLSNRPHRRPRSTIDSGRGTNKGLGVPSPRI